jgi:hypothetical protein
MLQYPEFGGCDGDPYKSLNNLLQCINTVLRRGKQMCREIKNEREGGGNGHVHVERSGEIEKPCSTIICNQRINRGSICRSCRYLKIGDLLTRMK